MLLWSSDLTGTVLFNLMFHKCCSTLEHGIFKNWNTTWEKLLSHKVGPFWWKNRVWTTEMPVSTTADKIRTHVVLIGLGTGRFQLLPSCSISDTSSLPQHPTALRVSPVAFHVWTQWAWRRGRFALTPKNNCITLGDCISSFASDYNYNYLVMITSPFSLI